MIASLDKKYEKTGPCFFFRLTYMRVPDVLHFIIGGRIDLNILFPTELIEKKRKLRLFLHLDHPIVPTVIFLEKNIFIMSAFSDNLSDFGFLIVTDFQQQTAVRV